MANCCYNLPFVTSIRTPGSGAVVVQNFVQQSHQAFYSAINPASNSSYHYQNISSFNNFTASNWERMNMIWGKNMNLTQATITVYCTTPGTSEFVTVSIDNSSDVVIQELTNTLRLDSNLTTVQWTGSTALTLDEPYRIMWETPNWVTPPTGVWFTTTLRFEL